MSDCAGPLSLAVMWSGPGTLPETTAVYHTGKKGAITPAACGLRTDDCGVGLVLVAVELGNVHLSKSSNIMFGLFSWQMKRCCSTCFQRTCLGSFIEIVVLNYMHFLFFKVLKMLSKQIHLGYYVTFHRLTRKKTKLQH